MENKQNFLTVKDHSVSGETFRLLYNASMEMLETSPVPSAERLPGYYQSDDYISHTDARRNLFEKAYHAVKQLALKRKLKLIASFETDSKSLLDVGCGTGDFMQMAQKNGWTVTGIEPSQQARMMADQKVPNTVFETEALDHFEPASFDVITLWHVLEHLPDPESQMALFKKLLKPNGTLVVAVPNFKSYDASHYQEFWAAYDVPRHLWHFSRKAMSMLVAKEQMGVVKTLPMVFDAYYVSLLSEKYKTGTMNPIKAFWVGCRSNWSARSSGEYSSLIYCIKNHNI